MPLYEYECAQCGKRFERIQKFSDPPTATCLACGGSVHRLVSPSAFQFKGSGWYVTDYPRKSAPSAKSEGDPSTDKPSDAKKEEKSPAKAAE